MATQTGFDLQTSDLHDPVATAVYEQRRSMGSDDWLEVTAGDSHPLGWWNRQTVYIPEYKAAQEALSEALNKTRLLLAQGTLNISERAELTGFLRMLAANAGRVKRKEKARHFLHLYFPWILLISRLIYRCPYQIFMTSWVLVFLSAGILTIAHGALPIMLTFAVPLLFTVGSVIGLSVYEDRLDKRSKKLHPTTRLFSVLPLLLILWASYGVVSVGGQLPIALKTEPRLVVSRDGVVQRAITVNNRIVRYPNLLETLLRGDAVVPLPEPLKPEYRSYPVPGLTEGKFTHSVATVLSSSPDALVGANYSTLPAERDELMRRVGTVTAEWCNGYRDGQPNQSITVLLNQLGSEHFAVKAEPGQLSWVKEEVRPAEKLVEVVTTTTDKRKEVVDEKVRESKQVSIP